GVRGRGARACAGMARLHRHNRLASSDAARDLAELPRVPEAFEVQKDHVRARILCPVLDEIVAGDVSLVADRRNTRNPYVQPLDVVENRETERPTLRRERDAPFRRMNGREGGIECEP